jgi:hypothetical protein
MCPLEEQPRPIPDVIDHLWKKICIKHDLPFRRSKPVTTHPYHSFTQSEIYGVDSRYRYTNVHVNNAFIRLSMYEQHAAVTNIQWRKCFNRSKNHALHEFLVIKLVEILQKDNKAGGKGKGEKNEDKPRVSVIVLERRAPRYPGEPESLSEGEGCCKSHSSSTSVNHFKIIYSHLTHCSFFGRRQRKRLMRPSYLQRMGSYNVFRHGHRSFCASY